MLPKFLLLAAFCAVAANSVLGANIIGKEMCGKGQVYWCSNIMNAKRCNAVKHCIQSVWEHQILPEDNGDICNICKDMVSQARAQLESNETQEELKQVFEGSCKLIPVQIVSEECVKMVDEFIPELVETLASQMNPQVVCSVAGLCNSVRNDKLLAEYKAKLPFKDSDCDGCREVVSTMRERFDKMNREDLMEDLLELCGRAGSLSDGCSSLVVTHLNTIYSHLTKFLRPRSVCDLAGICHAQYHRHKKPEVQIIHEGSIGMLSSGDKDDIPCALCEQLVVHLRDVLIANTTEDEFKLVLQGLCKQTGSFKSECLGLVDQYFSEIYGFLTKELDPNSACEAIHICPAKTSVKRPIAPLLPAEQTIPSKAELTQLPLRTDEHMTGGWKEEGFGRKDTHLPKVHVEIDSPKVLIPAEKAQLPIERTMPQTIAAVENRELCQMCEYFLHYLQQVLTTPATEEKLKEIVNGACEKLPKSIADTCTDFVNTYGDAIVALLAQEIDPSEVCPELGICPGKLLAVTRVEERPTCPLCLMAMNELDEMIKDNKTEANIKKALDELCLRMPKSISLACKDFVDGYTEELVDMFIADFTPEEVCVYLKLCMGKKNQPTNPKADFEILSNEIPEITHMEEVNKPILTHVPKKGNFKKFRDSSTCVICEFVMSQVENSLKNNATDEEIKHVVHSICNYMPKTVAKECNGFVDQYADLVISFLADYMDPKDVCSALKLCSSKIYHQLKRGFVKSQLCNRGHEATGVNPNEQFLKAKISRLPNCPAAVHLLGGKKCTWGPSYWCQSEFHANACKAMKHCQERVWNAERPPVAN